MRVLFAVSNDNITTSVVNKYQQKYKEIITSKNVYYFNAIIKELQINKSYDAIVIGEDLEPISNNNYEAVDKFLFEKLDGISDEASKPTGEDIPIIFICSDRRAQSDQLLIKLFGIGIYNAIIGNDRSIDTVCNLINKPRNKKEAKSYYRVESDKVGLYERENDQDVSENEIQNILSHYRKIGTNVKKCVESFNSISDQYNETQLRIIVNFLPNEVKSILEANSSKYQKLMKGGTVLSNGAYQAYQRQNPRKPGTIDFLTKDLEKTTMTKPVIIPSTININKSDLSRVQNNAQNQNPIEQGVNREGMSQMNNNMSNENISETVQKRGRGRPRKVAPTPSVSQSQSVAPSMNPQQVVAPNMSQPQSVEPSMNPQQVVAPNMSQSQSIEPSMSQPQVVAPSMSQPQSATPSVGQTQAVDSVIQQPKRKRGRPPKQTNSVVQPVVTPTPYVQPSAPVAPTPTVESTNYIPSEDENQLNAFDDILPGLEESDDTVDLFSMDPVGDTQSTTESAVLPGFDNDIESMGTTDESSDTNLFDLDLEENSQSAPSMPDVQPNQTMQNDAYDNVNNNPYGTSNTYNDLSNPYDTNSNLNNTYETNQNTSNIYDSYQPNSNVNSYTPNSYENQMTSTIPQDSYNTNVLAGNGKIVAFVGTTKNGTSFIVNNLAQLLSQNGVKTAVLDLTKNKNSYYMFTDNDANLMKKATDSLKNLSSGIVDGLEVNKNLTIFTSLPEENEELNKDIVLSTLSNNYEVALLDCDFETPADYFVSANEIYLIQSMDTFTIQPLTQFLSDLKLKNKLDESKLRIVINKYVKLKRLDEKLIIGGMSKYNEPSMTLQRDLFNAQTIKYVTIPFEMDTYARYLDSIAMCSLSLNGYSQNFLQALDELKNMVYPLISGGNRSISQLNNTEEKHGLFGGKKNKQQGPQTQFSNNVNDTLNRMRTNNF